MISTLVLPPPATVDASRRATALLRTLAALVPATIEGVVRDVTLLQVGEASLAGIADEAGCHLVEERDFAAALSRGVAAARCAWVLVIRAGSVPSRLFGEEVSRALEGSLRPDRAHLLREEPQRLHARWFPSLAPVAGIILPRARLEELRSASFADVVRRAGRASTLPSRAFALH